jgi:hypothetical protein
LRVLEGAMWWAGLWIVFLGFVFLFALVQLRLVLV